MAELQPTQQEVELFEEKFGTKESLSSHSDWHYDFIFRCGFGS